jgi:hypothetical protein
MSTEPYSREELTRVTISEFPKRGLLCPRCQTHIPSFGDLSEKEEKRIRLLDPVEQMRALREATGCNLRWAKIWVLHPNGPQSHKIGPPCPYCGQPLFTDQSKQCLECGWDWHNALRPVQHVVKKKPNPARGPDGHGSA